MNLGIANGIGQTMNRVLFEPALVGCVAGIASVIFLNGTSYNTTILGTMPEFIPTAVTVAGASYASEFLKQYIVPKDTNSKVLSNLAKPAITGVASIATSYVLGGGTFPDNMTTPFLVGAGSELVGDFSYEKFVSPYLKK